MSLLTHELELLATELQNFKIMNLEPLQVGVIIVKLSYGMLTGRYFFTR